MILTSYFANVKNFPDNKKKISISRLTPDWFKEDHNALELAPSKKLLFDYKNGRATEEDYIKRYKEETLSKLNPQDIYNKYDNSIFLCYEKTGDFCHRNIVADWLRENGFVIHELPKQIKIAIVGSRTFDDYTYFKKVVSRLISNYNNPTLVSGGAKGADSMAEQFASEFNIPIEVYKPQWYIDGVYDKSAGFKRNSVIWENSTMGIAFWDGSSKGTAHSFKLAKEKPLFIVEYNSKKIYLNYKN